MSRSSLILTLARQLGIRDPRAVLSVAAQEGLSGGIGDAGTSFGPFQLHRGGALPQHIANPHAWAWSRPGLIYALTQIKKVAGNRTGQDAIANIVNRFERPAAPGNEIAKALAWYQKQGGISPGPVDTSMPPSNNGLLQAIMRGGPLPLSVFKTPEMNGTPEMPPNMSLPNNGIAPAELIYKNHFLENGHPVKPIGGHETHVHVSENNPQAMLAAIALARKLGLRVGENPYVGDAPGRGIHAPHSFHYRTFPGKYNGRRLGEAIDVSGSPKLLQKYYTLLASYH